MATQHNFRIKNGLEVGGVLIVNSSGQLQAASISGAITATSLQLGSDAQPTLTGDGSQLKIQTTGGYVAIGPDNSSWMHFATDRNSFYFNKKITVNEGIVDSYDEDLQLRRAASTTARLRITAGTTISDQALTAPSVGVTNIVTNKVVKFDGTVLNDSNITDTGSLITLGSNTSVSGSITLSSNSTSVNTRSVLARDTNGLNIGTTNATTAISIDNSANVTMGYNLTVTGNLIVNGTTVTLNTATLDVEDKNITLNYGAGDTSGSANGAGITIQDAVNSTTNATILWDKANSRFTTSHGLDVGGTLTIPSSGPNFEIDITGSNAGNIRANSDLYILSQSGTLNLGAGGTNSQFSLATNGNATFSGTITSVSAIGAADNIRSGLTHDDSSAMAAGVGGQLVLGYRYTAGSGGVFTEGAIIKMYKENGTTGEYGSGLKFQVRNHLDNLSTKMTLDPSGNVDLTGVLTVVGASGTSVVQNIRNPNTAWSQYALTRYGSEGANVRYMDFGYYRGATEATRGLVVKSQANATLATFLDSGNVGIGTTAPDKKLEVAGDIKLANSGKLYLWADHDLNYLDYSTWRSSVSAGMSIMQTASSHLTLGTSNTERMRISSSGHVGIGDTLSVGGVTSTLKGYFYEDTFDQNGSAKPTSVLGVAASTNGTNEGPSIDFSSIWSQNSAYQQDNWNEGWTVGRIAGVYDNQVTNGGALVFYTHSGTTASGGAGNTEVSEKMRIRPNGNVGIGTSSPAAKLHVRDGDLLIQKGTGTTSVSELGFTNAFDTAFLRSSYTNPSASTETYLAFHTNTSGATNGTVAEQMRIVGNKVGIGTSSPAASLHIAATNNNNNGIMKLGARTWFSHTDQGQTHTFLANDYNDNAAQFGIRMKGVAESDEKFTILGSGNVGIGTTSPQSKLDVKLGNNETASIGGTISSGTYAGLRFGYSEAGNTNYRHSAIVFERDDAAFGDARGNIHILNSPSGSASADLGDARLTILPAGNVGIGETSPGQKLQVNGNIRADGHYYVGGSIVIDSSRNLTNIGTISSGAIQGSGTIDSTNVTTGTFRVYDGSTFRGGLGTGQWASGSTSQVGNWSLYAVGTLNFHSNNTGVPQVTQTSSGFNSTIPYQINGTTVIDANRQIFAKGNTQVGEDGAYGGYGVLGFGGITNGYNRVFGRNGTGDGLFLAAATGRNVFIRSNGEGSDSITLGTDGTYSGYKVVGFGGTVTNGRNRIFATADASQGLYINSATGRDIYFRTNGSGSDKFVMTASGNFQVASTTVIDASRNLENIVNATIRGDIDTRTAQNTTQTEKLKFGINNGNAAGTSDTIGGGVEWAPLYGGYSKRSAGILAIGEGNYFRAGLAFYTNNTANATTDWSERMRLTMEGNLNIVSGSLTMGGTTVIDANRNISAGTISSGVITATGGTSTNWNTAYGWGNHGSGGYAPIASPNFTGSMTVDSDVHLATDGNSRGVFVSYNSTSSYRGYWDWRTLQLGNNGANNILFGNTSTGGYGQFYVNATGISQSGATSGIHAFSMLATGEVVKEANERFTIKSHSNGWDGGLRMISQDGTDTFKIHPDNNGWMYVDKIWNFNGDIKMGGTTVLDTSRNLFVVNASADNVFNNGATNWYTNSSDRSHQRADARSDGTSNTFSRLHWYGVSHAQATSNFRHAWYDGSTYINVTAASGTVTFTGAITANNITGHNFKPVAGYHLQRSDHHSGHLEGSYNNVGGNGGKSNPIYTIGSSYNPVDADLSNMYGIGYTTYTTALTGTIPGGNDWGMYVAAGGVGRVWLDGANGNIGSVGGVYATNGYHVGTTQVIDASRNITGAEITGVQLTATDNLYLNGGNYEGQIIFGSNTTWRCGIRQHDDGDAELRIWAKNSDGRVHIATGYDGSPTSISKPTDGFVVDHNNVGIGNFSVTDPSEKLHVLGNAIFDNGTSTTVSVKCDDGGTALIRANGDGQGTGAVEVGQSNDYGGGMSYNGDSSPGWAAGETADHITFYRMSAGTRTEVFHYPYSANDVYFNGSITAAGNVTAYSDIRLKDDLQPIEDAVSKVQKLKGVTYFRNDNDDENRQAGLIAQDVELVLPEAVRETEDGIKTVNYNATIALLVESIKEQQTLINRLEKRINTLENNGE